MASRTRGSSSSDPGGRLVTPHDGPARGPEPAMELYYELPCKMKQLQHSSQHDSATQPVLTAVNSEECSGTVGQGPSFSSRDNACSMSRSLVQSPEHAADSMRPEVHLRRASSRRGDPASGSVPGPAHRRRCPPHLQAGLAPAANRKDTSYGNSSRKMIQPSGSMATCCKR